MWLISGVWCVCYCVVLEKVGLHAEHVLKHPRVVFGVEAKSLGTELDLVLLSNTCECFGFALGQVLWDLGMGVGVF